MLLILSPLVPRGRCRTLKLFEWRCKNEKVGRTNFKVDKPELTLLHQVLDMSGLGSTDMPTPGGGKPMLQAENQEAALAAWIADSWTNNGVFAPEVAQLRDLVFLTKVMVCDAHSLRDSLQVVDKGEVRPSWLKVAIVYPGMLLPTWEVTSGVNLCLRWGPYADMVNLGGVRAPPIPPSLGHVAPSPPNLPRCHVAGACPLGA